MFISSHDKKKIISLGLSFAIDFSVFIILSSAFAYVSRLKGVFKLKPTTHNTQLGINVQRKLLVEKVTAFSD